ncbi:bifunctional DNA-formamidopyrimidine glycosylase/DNA-(apurinic or apyrimidinic site) lyase [Desulfopila sp. IMCC35008]|uniref:bifunctional DNA-formamidopyrimidine glycosylase/DNA-(apurinic or apyrimidinic site) lyase n=1 Tax=Desulfopila sp. IMCC35008 TaxID=2653858 RepID=UPI0013D6B9FB|nr:bifunctional DNA-formamidopyrimidine glycosylase/DNA-(apurinic or apyrimidinic site) lyase [Desulfopila sp. IMCC35008]
MPELPEVETVCSGIRPHILDRSITDFRHSGKNLRHPVPTQAIHDTLLDTTIRSVRRRAKYILIEFDNQNLLAIHLGMTGNLGIFSPESTPTKHCHLRFALDNGMELRYTDIRRFGSIHLIAADEVVTIESTLFSTTGPEPFSDAFNPEYLYKLAQKRSIPVKNFIMTNQVVAGVGNIYANESLFQAGISPQRKANRISKKSWQTLIDAIRKVLTHAIECGGSTISDYVNADQESGYFQINFKVYGKAGEPCSQCEGIIQKKQIGGRASYHCPKCQK